MATATPRRALGDLNPNLRLASPAANLLKSASKPMTGSPLKRSFTAMVEDAAGFTYLKRRKLSGDEGIGEQEDGGGVVERERGRSVFSGSGSASRDEDSTGFRPPVPSFPTPNDPGPELSPSPIEPNTPSSTPDADADPAPNHTQTSFSSLINYDPSSQPAAAATATNTNTNNPPAPPLPPYAETLRLRLKIAIYKVRTNQIYTPFAKLVEKAPPPTAITALLASKTASSRRNVPELATAEAVEAAVAALRREAQLHQLHQQQHTLAAAPQAPTVFPLLGDLPAPVLRPTTFSSRVLYLAPHQGVLPSSPPLAHDVSRDVKVPARDAAAARDACAGAGRGIKQVA
ncbi:hypothetical protein LTR08_003489 [Meristemomyces frigidus]|nr:hypothetical protein LTR08_003489 [Meristemomyces frigidus]